jgi:hypothetical protein
VRLALSEEEELKTELRGAAVTRTVIYPALLRPFEKAMRSDNMRSKFQPAGLPPVNANRPMKSTYVQNQATRILATLERPGSHPISCPFLTSGENLANLEGARSFVFPEERISESANKGTRLSLNRFP